MTDTDKTIAALEAEIDRLRETVTRLNRRAIKAESGLLKKIEEAGGRTLGRALANSACSALRAKVQNLEAINAKLCAALSDAVGRAVDAQFTDDDPTPTERPSTGADPADTMRDEQIESMRFKR